VKGVRGTLSFSGKKNTIGKMRKNTDTQIELDFQDKTILLIGTAHVSRESVEEVKRVIYEEKPDLVCVEIDAQRYNAMTRNDNWEKLDIIKVIREGKGFLLIANLILSSFQRRLGNDLGVRPGEEMAAAVEAAKTLNVPFAFCDREVQLTLRRAWGECGFLSKCKLLSILLASAFSNEKLNEEEIENLKKNTELDGMMNELANYLPPVKKTLIDERDLYLAAKIWENGKTVKLNNTGTDTLPETAPVNDARKIKIVAVAGAGHLNGIKAHLEEFSKKNLATIDLSETEKIPGPGFFIKHAGLIIPLIIIIVIAIGFYKGGTGAGLDQIVKWIILNGGFAALGSLLAWGNILTILISFISAPIGTLNPFLSVGLFAAITQAVIRRPRIHDAENLNTDISSIRGIYRNRILHILLIFFLSSLGGAAGNIITLTPLGSSIENFIFTRLNSIITFFAL
jgi:pheromone shutdown protein TraB